MFAQNLILKAKEFSLGVCCCYASEHLNKSQSYWRNKFNLPKEYYCSLSILIGFPKELVEKPTRLDVKKIVEFKNKTIDVLKKKNL